MLDDVFVIDPVRLDALMKRDLSAFGIIMDFNAKITAQTKGKRAMFNDEYFQSSGFESRASWLAIAGSVYHKDTNQVLAISAQAEIAGADNYFTAFDIIATGGTWE